jgi:hypothetical protein
LKLLRRKAHCSSNESVADKSRLFNFIPMPTITKYLFLFGAILILAGIAWWFFGDKLKWFGKLPGDIRVENESGGFYFPVVTCIIISIAISILIWVVRRFL